MQNAVKHLYRNSKIVYFSGKVLRQVQHYLLDVVFN